MAIYPLFFAAVVVALVALFWYRGSLDETARRISRHWIPFLAYFFLCFVAAGYALNNFGVPSLFRDDPQLFDLHGWAAIRNSAVVWSQCFGTLFLFAIWAFVYHFEAVDGRPVTTPAGKQQTARAFVKDNGLPMVLFLLGAAALPKKSDALIAVADLAKGALGIVLAMGILWLVTALGGILLQLFNRYKLMTAFRRPARLLDFLSLFLIGAPVPATPREAGVSGAMARIKQAGNSLAKPLATSTSRRLAVGGVIVFMITLILTLGVVTIYPILQSSVSIVLLLAWLLVLYFFVAFARPGLKLWVVVGIGAYIALVNAGPFQHTFPALASYYDKPRPLVPGDPGSVTASPSGLVPPVATLDTWHDGPGADCKHLVIIATSGGAYRAAYWTAAILDEIEKRVNEQPEFKGLNNCIRLITGASGGMVGAAYYVAMRNETFENGSQKPGQIGSVIDRLNEDTLNSRANGEYFPTRFPYARDSLTPVAQQLAQRDFFHIFSGQRMKVDRGLVLEKQWTALNIPFADLREREEKALVPSLLVSPMAFSTIGKPFAQPLLISNLNVDTLTGEDWRHAFPFFALFPATIDSFLVSTAIRMNATFPYVSPAVSLPTIPPTRVVDAGYYENYGLAMAASWLFSARDTPEGESALDWLKRKELGVILIQVRAFPFDSPLPKIDSRCHRGQPKKKEEGKATGHGFQFLTTPVEAVGAVRESGMNIRNDQQVNLVDALMKEHGVHAVSFENTTDVGMSWYLTPLELECLEEEVRSTYNGTQWNKLNSLLQEPDARVGPAMYEGTAATTQR